MELWTLLVILAAVWVLTNFWLLPIVRERWKGADLRSKLARVGSLVVLERLRDLTAVGTVTSLGLLVLVWTLSAVADGPAGIAKTIIGAVASMYAVAKACSEGYGTALVILGIAGASLALFVAARNARQSVSAMWIAKARRPAPKNTSSRLPSASRT